MDTLTPTSNFFIKFMRLFHRSGERVEKRSSLNNHYVIVTFRTMKVYDFFHTNKLKKEQVFPSMRGCLIKLQTDEDPDEGVKVIIIENIE